MPKAKPESSSAPMRLQKFIADCGVTSRRKAEQMIVQGEVKLNGRICRELGTKVDPETDVVEVAGTILNLLAVEKIYVLLNKPRAVMTTVSDPEGRSTVIDYCKGIDARIFPVGRLDYHSEGLLILTNDGEMANLIMHPRYEVTKVYEVKIFGAVNEGIVAKLRNGMMFPEGFVKPKSVRVVETLPNKTWIEFRLAEGKNREIRRLCEACDLTIDKLRRVAIEGLTIQGLAPGSYRIMTKNELMRALGINADGTKKNMTPTFVSAKKTVDVKDRVVRRKVGADRGNEKGPTKLANDPAFARYRKETYKETIQEQRAKAAERAAERGEVLEEPKSAAQKKAEQMKERGALRGPGSMPFKNAKKPARKKVVKKRTEDKAPVRRNSRKSTR
ncbi:MAG: pseudouridine synthase [Bacteriovoracaceae bacterium]